MWSVGVLVTEAACQSTGQEAGVRDKQLHQVADLGKFTSLGLDVSAEEIYSSSYAAAAYLESINFPKDKKVPAAAATHLRQTPGHL